MKRNSLLLVLASALLAPAVNAQTSSSTPVIGYYKFDVPAGSTVWNCAFVTKKDFQGAASSLTSPSTINQTSAAFPTGPAGFTSHYVEILSGPSTGLILDIVSNTATEIVVDGDLAALGVTGTPTYCVRKHAKLSTIFAGGAGLAPIDDSVEVFDDAGGSVLAAFDGAQWVDGIDFTTPVDATIYPGQGFKISSLGGATVTFGGGEVSYVKTGPTKVPVFAGVVNLVGVINPLVSTTPALPADQATLGQLGFSSLAPIDDLITVFSTDGILDEVVYAHDGANVVDGSSFTVNSDAVPVRNGQAFLISPLSDGTYTQPQLIP